MVEYAHVSVETMLKSACDWGMFVTMYLVKVAVCVCCVHKCV